tara:strand:+ start:20503 stop:21087 length:585 start_codon:yes stop_codon:yes gene_type:complete
MKKLTEADYQHAAELLGCEVAAIKAVAKVESGGRSGFMKDGETPKILFEGHWFHKLTGGGYTCPQEHPEWANISHKKWVRKYYKEDQHARLQKATALDRDAALQSASWGKFQVMGFNWKISGFKSLQDFVNAMYKSEAGHLLAFVNFVKHRRLDDELRAKDWAGFAFGYNGRGYAANNYDGKMAAAYNLYKYDQ